LSKTDPGLFFIVKNERFLGARGNVYQLQIPFAKKEFTYMKLGQPKRRDTIVAALTEAAGTPLGFEAVLERDPSLKQAQSSRDDAQTQLVEAFGRDMVQVDPGTEGNA
ncbi:MAG: hypothetical protein PHY12_12730, partial [Eubacteriales bacterium]|nr:hypothetical protein [Eubacteriales bacterium]